MSRPRLTSARILFPVVASLLVLGIVGAELPELFSLVDNTSNDFMVRKVSRAEGARPFAAASHGSLLPDTRNLGCGTRTYGAAAVLGTGLVSFELFRLHSVLRR
jgi:hypothetical protein